jgi:hypothetical protein
MLASTQETSLIKKVNSNLIQAATSFKITTQRSKERKKQKRRELAHDGLQGNI